MAQALKASRAATLTASFVSVAALDAFKAWAKGHYGIDVKTNYTAKGTQLAFASEDGDAGLLAL